MKRLWLCENPGCSHRASRRRHRQMVVAITKNAGVAMAEQFESVHPNPDTAVCDDCHAVGGRHRLSVEH